MTYPDGVVATTTYDFLERPKSLTAQVGLQGSFFIVTNATYKALGPLSSLTFGNGVTETRAFDNRSIPTRIQATRSAGTLLDWNYTTDAIGNITAIGDALNSANNRTYTYLDQHYFLTQGNGPWGNLSWTYDKIGNRLTETRGGVTETYTYLTNPAGGHDPRLDLTTTTDYTYDAIGDVTRISSSAGMVDLTYDPARRMDSLQKTGTSTLTGMLYDGRGFLWKAGLQTGSFNAGPVEQETVYSTYSSEGRLYHWKRDLSIFQTFEGSRLPETPLTAATAPSSFFTRGPVSTLYFGDRLIATIDQNGGFTQRTFYLTTDHLGTPILATAPDGSIVWQGGFEPFGKDWNGAGEAGVFLRFPGQWADRVWEGPFTGLLYLNGYRWYYAASGRYERPDPFGAVSSAEPYLYVAGNPLKGVDPLGLFRIDSSCDCSNPADSGPGSLLGVTIRKACKYLQRPGCRDALRAHGLEKCYSERCSEPIGKGPLIVCSNLTDACGLTVPGGNMVIYKGDMTCPRIFQGKNKPPGARDYSQTLFHEIGHGCGVGAEEPNWWKEVQNICTGWPL